MIKIFHGSPKEVEQAVNDWMSEGLKIIIKDMFQSSFCDYKTGAEIVHFTIFFGPRTPL